MRKKYETGRGPVLPPEAGKTSITLRLDTDVLEWFRQRVEAGGGDYRGDINHVLRMHMAEEQAKGSRRDAER